MRALFHHPRVRSAVMWALEFASLIALFGIIWMFFALAWALDAEALRSIPDL